MKSRAYWFFLPVLFLTTLSPLHADEVLEPFIYTENFETQELGAWAAYPHWEDTAFNEYFRVDTMVPGDPNWSIEQMVTPYTHVDNYAGAQKLLDMYLTPGSSVTFRYYLKSNLPFGYIEVRLAAGDDGMVTYTILSPLLNRWEWVTVTFENFLEQNPRLAGRDRIKVNALAVLAKQPLGDPAMKFYFGLDDITVRGSRATAFQFVEPAMYKLAEWKPYIARKHYRKGEHLTLKGAWPFDADRVTLTVAPFTDRSKTVFDAELKRQGGLWTMKPVTLSCADGLYLGIIRAYGGKSLLSETEFSFLIAPQDMAGKHPRLWFDSSSYKAVKARLNSPKFKNVADGIRTNAQSYREKNPVSGIVFDIDQFPREDWLASLDGWFDRVGIWRWGIWYNTLAYAFFDDREAGIYAKDLLVELSKFSYWVHPWFIKRGQFIYYPLGEAGTEFAIGYDCLYGLMTGEERALVRHGLWKNIVLGCHRGYVENNLTTNNTSNWVSNIASGSLICQAAMYGDGPDVEPPEPYLTGALFKEYALIQCGFGRDGGYGEPNGYYYFTMDGLSEALPAVENVFGIDMTQKINRSYTELIWAGLVKKKYTFYYGKSSGELRPLNNWTWLLPKYRDPLLGWFYNFMKDGETLRDAIYDTENVPREDPFGQNPVRVFRDIGTTVFKSGWEPDDFVFVMRTGPFYNHQFMDQGSFWLSDRGSMFIERRHGSTEPYLGAVLYEPWYIQPVSHSTILIDGNHQSQRTGDTLNFARGFEDYAFISQFLDGADASFVSGDIGRLYWGKVRELRRNVLYLKPRTLLMLDTVIPAEKDVDVTLLYQTLRLEDIHPGDRMSTITKDGNILYIKHLNPGSPEIRSIETPHYLYTLLREKPLKREGMLTVTARTKGVPLVMANILTSTAGPEPEITAYTGKDYTGGTVSGIPYVFSTRPGARYDTGTFLTDAAAVTWKESTVFAALCTTLTRDSRLLVRSEKPVTCELSDGSMKYCLSADSDVEIGVDAKPRSISVNGKRIDSFVYDREQKTIKLKLQAGEGTISF
ncbi:heparinase II/III-family protein [bacterium]|nr:heparinase II/III-family protein [bacterium]